MPVTKNVPLEELKQHPDNPRIIGEYELENLKNSIVEFPEMLEARPIVVNKDMQILSGNQRYTALKELGRTTAKVTIVDWTEQQQKEFMIKDNLNNGQWDYNSLLNSWQTEDLSNWGVNVGVWNPILNPESEEQPVSEEDVARTQHELENKFKQENQDSKYINIICKNCGKEYYADT